MVTEIKKARSYQYIALYVNQQQNLNTAGITDIADALNRMPGITIRDYGGAGGMKTVSVRSFGTQHTGVSYDGIMLSDCQSGQIDLSRYSLETSTTYRLSSAIMTTFLYPQKCQFTGIH